MIATSKYTHQSPYPKVLAINPDTKQQINLSDSLQSYQWQLSINDITGSFSLQFYPEDLNTYASVIKKAIFDEVNILDVIEIYEGATSTTLANPPVFIGVVRSKKYASQAQDGGGVRRLSVSGTAITGLASQFALNLDTTACAITKQMAENESIRKKLSINLLSEAGKPKPLKDVVKAIWEHFLNISNDYGDLSNPKIAEYINSFLGENASFFDIQDIEFKYPIGCVFDGKSSRDFFSIIDSILPSPYYEKFSYTDTNGKMKIKIREIPFEISDWNNLPCTAITGKYIKALDLEETDKEVYTVFFAYLDGSPKDEAFLLKLKAAEESADSVVKVDSDKYGKYGYKPLIVHFRGYGTSDAKKEDTSTEDAIKEVTQKLCDCFSHLDEMLKGSVTLAMDFTGDVSRIMPGETVSMLGSSTFYVEGVSHSWHYGAGGDINLSLSRGGVYTGSFRKTTNLTDYYKLLVKGEDNESVAYNTVHT